MIHLKVKELCLERGITTPVVTLMKIGISQGVFTKYLTKKASDTFRIRGFFVVMFQENYCTNTLFNWLLLLALKRTKYMPLPQLAVVC